MKVDQAQRREGREDKPPKAKLLYVCLVFGFQSFVVGCVSSLSRLSGFSFGLFARFVSLLLFALIGGWFVREIQTAL